MKKKVLFLCIHNSARSQMAEAYLKKFGGDRFHVSSAGLEKGQLNPLAIEVMLEEGIDISTNETTAVLDLLQQDKRFDIVITVCDAAHAEKCPVFPGVHKKIHWEFDDPSTFTGTPSDKLNQTRQVRNQIREAVQNFITEHLP